MDWRAAARVEMLGAVPIQRRSCQHRLGARDVCALQSGRQVLPMPPLRRFTSSTSSQAVPDGQHWSNIAARMVFGRGQGPGRRKSLAALSRFRSRGSPESSGCGPGADATHRQIQGFGCSRGSACCGRSPSSARSSMVRGRGSSHPTPIKASRRGRDTAHIRNIQASGTMDLAGYTASVAELVFDVFETTSVICVSLVSGFGNLPTLSRTSEAASDRLLPRAGQNAQHFDVYGAATHQVLTSWTCRRWRGMTSATSRSSYSEPRRTRAVFGTDGTDGNRTVRSNLLLSSSPCSTKSAPQRPTSLPRSERSASATRVR
ncbi:hypothetical protein V8E36_009604 [Tilletia maclaganii]